MGDSKVRPRKTNKPSWILKNTGGVIQSVHSQAVEPSLVPVESRSGFRTIGSFSWCSKDASLIHVPGSPAKFTPPTLPTTVRKDKGTRSKFHRGTEELYTGYLPLLASLTILTPTFRFDKVNLLTHRNSLRKLFGFVCGRVYESFRIDVQLVRNTVVLIRRERDLNMILYGSQNSGYGRNFESAFTTPEMGFEDSHGHHRAIHYSLGELCCVVQFEVDAWYDTALTQSSSVYANRYIQETPLNTGAIIESLEHLSLSPKEAPESLFHVNGEKKLKIRNMGQKIDDGKLAEIKTCKRASNRHKKDKFPQLWFGRTSYLITGMHENGDGAFTKVDICDMGKEFPSREQQQQGGLRKLATLIQEIRSAAKSTRENKCVVACDHTKKPPQLQILTDTVGAGKIIARELVDRFWKSPT